MGLAIGWCSVALLVVAGIFHRGTLAATGAARAAGSGGPDCRASDGALFPGSGDLPPGRLRQLLGLTVLLRREPFDLPGAGDKRRTAAVLRELGGMDAELGLESEARPLLEESLRLERELANKHGIARSLHSLGLVKLLHHDYAVAEAYPLLEESLSILRELKDELYVAFGLNLLAVLATNQGDYATARSCFVEVAEATSLQQHRWGTPYLLEGLAGLASAQRQPAHALRLAGAAHALREAIGASTPPWWQASLERQLEPARRALDEGASVAAWEEGRAMTPEQAIAFALDEPPSVEADPKARPEPLRIFALGEARVEHDQRVLASSDWAYPKSRELLYYLLSHPSRAKEQIGLALWPEASSAQLRSTFHVTLHNLRRALGEPGWIVFENGRYAFNRRADDPASRPYFFDVEGFEFELAQARKVQTQAQAAVPHLQRAVELYGGDFLEDSADGDWAMIGQEELRSRYLEALLSLGRLLIDADRCAEAAGAFRRAIAHDNLLEEAHRELMRCQAALGERGQATRHYGELVKLLGEELGTRPAPETVALYESLREDV